MALRRPLVAVSGTTRELPIGDTLPTADLGMVSAMDYGATGNGSTNDTSAISSAYTAAAAAGKPLFLPPGTYLVTSLPAFADRDVVVGAGPTLTMIKYAGTGTLKTFSGVYGMVFRDIGFWATGAGATLLQLSGCFRFSFRNVIFRGAHDDGTGSTYHTQVGLKLDNNTGATFISHCDFENLGVGLQTSCIQNQVTLSKFTVCYRSVYGVGGTANAGLSISNVEFVGGADGTTETHIYIDGSANCWTLFAVWFEKATYACRVGVGGTGGPSQWTMIGCKIGAKTTGVDLIYCRQPLLINNEWDEDQGGVQTELVINATNAEEGVAIGNVTTLQADIPDSVFPQYWFVTRKGSVRGGNFTAANLKITGGSPGSGKVLTSDADGDASWQTPAGQDATLTALAGLTTSADQMIYSTGADAFAMTGLTSTARSLLDDTSTSAMRTTLGLAIGTNVQAWDADLDTWAGKTAPSGTAVGTSDTQTLTNKRVTKRTGTTTSSATPTINADNVDFYSLTAQTVDVTSFSTNLSGTPTEGQTLWIAITGTASRAITWGASFETSTVALPTTTSGTARLDVGFVWNSVTSKWRVVAVA